MVNFIKRLISKITYREVFLISLYLYLSVFLTVWIVADISKAGNSALNTFFWSSIILSLFAKDGKKSDNIFDNNKKYK